MTSGKGHHMTTVREVIKRDIGIKVEGVVKVFDRSLCLAASEVREVSLSPTRSRMSSSA